MNLLVINGEFLMSNIAEKSSTTPISVSKADLPLVCPRPDSPLWCQHPRVFLAVDAEQKACCPYCGAQYQLV